MHTHTLWRALRFRHRAQGARAHHHCPNGNCFRSSLVHPWFTGFSWWIADTKYFGKKNVSQRYFFFICAICLFLSSSSGSSSGAQVEYAKWRTSLILQSRKAAVKHGSGSFGEDAWLCPTPLHHGSLLCLREGWGEKKWLFQPRGIITSDGLRQELLVPHWNSQVPLIAL